MTLQDNLEEAQLLGLNYFGNIFFEKSPRNLNGLLKSGIEKVGVFVKESIGEIEQKVKQHGLTVVQLHGGESNEVCAAVKGFGVEVWKVFSVGVDFDFEDLNNYPAADYFLFDTKSPKHGGTGRKFDWSVLNKIDELSSKQYFLSGGIGPDDANEIKQLKLQKLIGLDLNSKFETSPGVKNVDSLKQFLQELRS